MMVVMVLIMPRRFQLGYLILGVRQRLLQLSERILLTLTVAEHQERLAFHRQNPTVVLIQQPHRQVGNWHVRP